MRRARIKAVAALPPRRKNAEATEHNRNKTIIPPKDSAEPLKSPKTHRQYSPCSKSEHSSTEWAPITSEIVFSPKGNPSKLSGQISVITSPGFDNPNQKLADLPEVSLVPNTIGNDTQNTNQASSGLPEVSIFPTSGSSTIFYVPRQVENYGEAPASNKQSEDLPEVTIFPKSSVNIEVNQSKDLREVKTSIVYDDNQHFREKCSDSKEGVSFLKPVENVDAPNCIKSSAPLSQLSILPKPIVDVDCKLKYNRLSKESPQVRILSCPVNNVNKTHISTETSTEIVKETSNNFKETPSHKLETHLRVDEYRNNIINSINNDCEEAVDPNTASNLDKTLISTEILDKMSKNFEEKQSQYPSDYFQKCSSVDGYRTNIINSIVNEEIIVSDINLDKSLISTEIINEMSKNFDENQSQYSNRKIQRYTSMDEYRNNIINSNNDDHEESVDVLPNNAITGLQSHNDIGTPNSNINENYVTNHPSYLDDNVQSVPESSTEEGAMKVITSVKSAAEGSGSLELLKSEAISENHEALFDPIIPLPSPSKVRPKLRPAPRLAPHRRNSIQGSASESEDETRRAQFSGAPTHAPPPPRQRHDSHTLPYPVQLVITKEVGRVRNDSVCSSVSQATSLAATHPQPASSPVKEKHLSKARRQEMGKRMWRRRRDATVKRDALTMYDLIFYNPSDNPIIPDQDELKAKEENARDEAARLAKSHDSEDEPPPAPAAPVPQIKLGPNGEIVLDEKSLVIKQSDANRKVSSVVREGAWGGTNGGRYTRSPRTAEWSESETVRFYRSLAAVGTDFSLMAQLFPDRTRKDLKLKFKKEERINGSQVDMALRSATAWDVLALQQDFRKEREIAAQQAEEKRQRLLEQKQAERERLKAARELRVRHSRGSKAMESTVDRRYSHTRFTTADEFVQRAIETRAVPAERKRNVTKAHQQSPPPAAPLVAEQHPPHFATLTLVAKDKPTQRTQPESSTTELATLSKVEPKPDTSVVASEIPTVPPNIETGSLVVLRVNDPKSPTKTILQTYIAHGAGKLTPVSLPSTFLNSVVGYMKMGSPKGPVPTGSSPIMSPSSVTSHDSRHGSPSVIQMNPNPAKKRRLSSFTITPL